MAKTTSASGCGGLRCIEPRMRCDARPSGRRQPPASGWTTCTPDGGEVISAGVQSRVEDLLRGLPESMRVAVVLRYQEEMLPDEIAQLLAQPVATVKSNLHRGLKLLRRKAAVTMKEYVRETA